MNQYKYRSEYIQCHAHANILVVSLIPRMDRYYADHFSANMSIPKSNKEVVISQMKMEMGIP